eukprot:gene28900-32349_t
MKKTAADDHKFPEPVAPDLGPDSDALPHPGALIRDELKAAGYSIPQAAVAMATNRPNLNNMLLGKVALTRDIAYRVNVLINPDDEEFEFAKLVIGMQAAHDWGKDSAMRSALRTVVLTSVKSLARAQAKTVEA